MPFELKNLLYQVLPQIFVLRWGPCVVPKYPLCLHLPVQIHPVRLQILIISWHPLWRGFIGLGSFFTYINNLIFSNVAVNKHNQRVHWLRLEEGEGRTGNNNVRICSLRKMKHFFIFSRTTVAIKSLANVNCEDGNLCRKPLHRHRHLRLVSIEIWVPASSTENPDWHFVLSER